MPGSEVERSYGGVGVVVIVVVGVVVVIGAVVVGVKRRRRQLEGVLSYTDCKN
jgi:hypothetical protein